MCCHPDCKQKLHVEATAHDEAATSIGQAAHIVARSGDGPRGAPPEETPADLHCYSNLILLCANHHAMVDAQEKTYTVDVLRSWKAEHEAWVESITADKPVPLPWTAILQEEGRAIDGALIDAALGRGSRVAELLELRNQPDLDGWEAAATREWRDASLAVSETPAGRRRFAVFSLGRIPLAVQLGYVLGDRARADLFHYDRDRGTWSWPEDPAPAGAVTWTLHNCDQGPANEAAVRVSLSASVRPEPGLRCGAEIDIRVLEPSVRWLRAPSQLAELALVYGQALASLRNRGCRRVHLYYAGPAAGAIVFGRGYNPRMNPELVVYEYRRGASPSYEQALVLNR
jgi:hypothetical protein